MAKYIKQEMNDLQKTGEQKSFYRMKIERNIDAQEFVEHAMELVPNGAKVAMFLKLQFLEGKARRELFKKYPPKTVYVSSSRLICAKNGDFESVTSSAVAYCWYVWVKGFKGDTIIKWCN